MSQKLSFFRYFHLMAIAVFLLFSVAFFGFSFYNIKHKFYDDVATLKESYFQTQKELLQKEVNRFIEEIDQKRRSAYANTQRLVHARVDEAYNVAMHIYDENKGKRSQAEIQERIIQTLRMLRYEQNKGYFFILDLNGTAMLLTNHPEMEGKTLVNVQNSEGRCIAKGMIDIAKTMSEGYYEYLWSKPFEEADNHKKISYIKRFEPFDWLIGTGYYVEDTETQIRQEIVTDDRHFRFDDQQGGYVFIGTWEGFSLSYPAPNRNMYDLQDAHGKRVVQELIQKAKDGGGFVEYVMPPLQNEKALPKQSYVRAYPDWRWYVGAGVYVDKIEQEIAQLEAKMYGELKAMLSSIGMWIALFIATVWTVYFYLNRRLRKDFETFIAFLTLWRAKTD